MRRRCTWLVLGLLLIACDDEGSQTQEDLSLEVEVSVLEPEPETTDLVAEEIEEIEPELLAQGMACDPAQPVSQCEEGLVCIPSGSCEQICEEYYCEGGNPSYCYGSSVRERACPQESLPHCVAADGRISVCRDIELDYPNLYCDGELGYSNSFHFTNEIPQGCFGGSLVFVGSRLCLSGVSDTGLTHLGGSLRVITSDPVGYTDPASCDYFSSVELPQLQEILGDLEVGEVSWYTDRSEMKVAFEDLELPQLRAIFGRLWWTEAEQVQHLNYPALELVGGFFVLDDLPSLEIVYLPKLKVIEGGMRLHDLPHLKTLNLEGLERIDGYLSIMNVPCLSQEERDRLAAMATGPVSVGSPNPERCEEQ